MEEIVKTAPNRRQRRPSRGKFWLLALLWLPLGIAATAVVRGFGLPLESQAWLSLVVVASCGLPLAFAWSAIHGLGYPRTAGSICGILALATAVLSLMAGLLGPIGIAAYAIVLSLPAWVLYAILRLRVRQELV